MTLEIIFKNIISSTLQFGQSLFHQNGFPSQHLPKFNDINDSHYMVH